MTKATSITFPTPQAARSLIRVGIVDDDKGTRQALAGFLQGDSEIECIGTFGSAEEALRDLPAKRPDVVIMDVNLPKMDGVQCVRELVGKLPDVQVVMLTVYDNTDVIFQSLAAGAKGYLLKPIRAAQLLTAVRDVIGGGAPLTSNIARKLVQAFAEPAAPTAKLSGSREPDAQRDAVEAALSPREREVLDLLARGYLYKEIAKTFNVSYSTVHTHIERIYHKLHVRSRAQAVAKIYGPRQ
ncbi:MAG: response regulator transcription factor [Planctomycetia bacterium]|nr:response regulator transcription factor [Planctomycetia bacterium]